MSSDVFDSYAKIMQDQGHMDKPLEKMAEEKPLRHDSMDVSDFQLLYGVKPNGKDEEDMAHQAHKEPLFIAPAYDKMNGLVENLWERHSIMCDIALKPTDGKHTQERYVKANAELINELTRVAFLLDKNGEEELMKRADECAEGLHKKAVIAAAWYVVPAVISGIGYIWNQFGKDAVMSQGVSQDAEKFMVEMQDVIDDEAEKHPEFLSEITTLIEEVRVIKEFADKSMKIQATAMRLSADKDQAIRVSNGVLSSDDHAKIINFFTRYGVAAATLQESIPDYVELLKQREQEFKSRKWDSWQMLEKAYRAIMPSEFGDVITALLALHESLAGVPKYIQAKLNIMQKLSEHKDDLEQVTNLLQTENMSVEKLEEMAKQKGAKDPAAPSAKPEPSKVPELPGEFA